MGKSRTISRRDLFKFAGLGAGVAGVVALAGCNNGSSDDNGGATTATSNNASSSSNTSADSDFVTLETVEIKPGQLLGFRERGVYNFRGIPYATAERFQNPVPIDSFETGIQNALIYGPVSPQDRTLSATGQVNPYEFFTPSNGTADMVGNEQCQYLNVWTNNLSGSKPVLVFFHGGGLANGASSELSTYEGQDFARTHDVVFVSVNTRLNVLGFLDMSAYGSQFAESGIAGMKDGVAALQWVQDNIAAFGGDPSNVTILGQSGGGEKVTTLASMAETEGLFNKVVMMSGMYDAAPQSEALANTEQLVSQLGLSRSEVASTLTTMPYEQLLQAASQIRGLVSSTHYGTGTYDAPFIDVATGAINEHAAKRQWLIGTAYSEFNSNELAWFSFQRQETPNSHLSDVSDDDARSALQALYGNDTDEFISEYQKAYPNHALVESLWMSQGNSGISRYGLTNPDTGTITLLNNAGIPVFNYVTAYRLPVFGGVTMAHSTDIGFMFNSIDAETYLIRGDEDNAHKMATAASDALAAFVTSGDPSTDSLSWPAYESGSHNTMVFDVDSEVRVGHDDRLYEIMQAHTPDDQQ